MRTCEYAGEPFREPRSHPWVDAKTDSHCRYYDFTKTPASIRTALEDFMPWARYSGVQDFYALLERLNHRSSPLESNDCAFTGPAPTVDQGAHKPMECSGRLMVLYRDLARNTQPGATEHLSLELHQVLATKDPSFRSGVIGTTLIPVRYLALAEAAEPPMGSQLMISFWAWGRSEAETMANLARLFTNLGQALRRVGKRLS